VVRSVAPAVLVDLDLEALRHTRLLAIFRNVAERAGDSGSATTAAVPAFPWSPWMLLAHPSAIVAARTDGPARQPLRQLPGMDLVAGG